MTPLVHAHHALAQLESRVDAMREAARAAWRDTGHREVLRDLEDDLDELLPEVARLRAEVQRALRAQAIESGDEPVLPPAESPEIGLSLGELRRLARLARAAGWDDMERRLEGLCAAGSDWVIHAPRGER